MGYRNSSVLLCPVHHTDRERCLYFVLVQHLQHLDASVDAQYPVVPTSAWLRVQMGASESCWSIGFARPYGKDIPHGVD